MPHVFIEPGISVHDILGLYFTLIIVDDATTAAFEIQAQELGVPLTVRRLRRPDLRPIFARNFLLVRPDQHITWRGDEAPMNIRALLKRATGRL